MTSLVPVTKFYPSLHIFSRETLHINVSKKTTILLLFSDYYDVVSLIDALAKHEVDGILVERYAAGAHYNQFKSLGMELGKVTTFPYDIGMQVVGEKNTSMCTAFKKCIMDITKKFNIAMVIVFDYQTNVTLHR